MKWFHPKQDAGRGSGGVNLNPPRLSPKYMFSRKRKKKKKEIEKERETESGTIFFL